MESNSKPTMFQTTLTWGLITGFAAIVYSLILYFAGIIGNQIAGYAGALITIAGIYLGTKAFRDQGQDGFITYGRALGTGVLISLFATILSVIFMIILYTVIDPELPSRLMAETQDRMIEKGLPEDQIAQGMEMTKRLFIPMAIIGGLIMGVLMGFIISLVTSAILKKEQGDSFTRDMSAIKTE
jgi:hypothetical protein